MTAPRAFFDNLDPGDLVAASVESSTKLHLIRVVRRVTNKMVKGNLSDDRLRGLFDGRPFCEVRPRRWWWTPVEQLEDWQDQDRCRWCFSRWRSSGRPTIKGWAHPEAPVVDALRLPWGWREVTPTGHPLDLALDAADPEDDDEREVGSKRVEVRRWLRGNRYVRITQSLVDARFCVRYGALDDDADDERWALRGGRNDVLLKAATLMALGGRDSSGTRTTLTMDDIVKGA